MVDVAVARAHTHGLYNVHGRRLDIEDIAEPDAAFDVVYCRDGLQFALDPQRASHEIARVLQALRAGERSPSGPSVSATRGWASCSTLLSEQLGQPVPPPGIAGPVLARRRNPPPGSCSSRRGSAMCRRGGAGSAARAFVRRMVADDDVARRSARADPRRSRRRVQRTALRTRAREAAEPFKNAEGALDIPGMAILISARR